MQLMLLVLYERSNFKLMLLNIEPGFTPHTFLSLQCRITLNPNSVMPLCDDRPSE